MALNTKTDVFEGDILKLVFQNVAITGIGDAGGLLPSAAAGNLYVSLHTADPLDAAAGGQAQSEIATAVYGQYARVAVPRTTAGWAFTSPDTMKPFAAINFAQMTSGTGGGVVTHAGIGSAASGAGKLMYTGTVTPNITVNTGVTPSLTTSSSIIED